MTQTKVYKGGKKRKGKGVKNAYVQIGEKEIINHMFQRDERDDVYKKIGRVFLKKFFHMCNSI